MQANVLLLPGLQLGARLFCVQVCDMRLPQVFLNGVLDRRIMFVGIQKLERLGARAHIAAVRQLEHVVLESLNDE